MATATASTKHRQPKAYLVHKDLVLPWFAMLSAPKTQALYLRLYSYTLDGSRQWYRGQIIPDKDNGNPIRKKHEKNFMFWRQQHLRL